jgi:UDP-N-acetylmuramoyl-tripeptide--D-alanyl-D-alanine ligase
MRGAPLATHSATLTIGETALTTRGRIVAGSPDVSYAGVSIDSRTLEPGQLFVAIKGPRFDGHAFLAQAAARGAAAALVHVDAEAPAGLPLVRVADTTQALADLARHVRQSVGVPVVAITGSTGKTTTKEMAAALVAALGPILKTEGNLNNQYGLPLMLLKLGVEHRAAVLELGMSAQGELAALSGIALPDVAVITNVAPVHLEFFESVDAIAAAKAEILVGLSPSGVAVLNGDDVRLRAIGERHAGRVLWFGRDRRYYASAENWRGTAFGMRFDMLLGGQKHDVALPLAGAHFVSNFLAAAATAHHLGVSAEAIAEAASHLEAAPHRGQVLRLPGGITLVDDAYNSNPVAVEAAVGALAMAGGKRRVAFLGDMLELGPTGPALHRQTGERIAGGLDVVVAVGSLAAALADGVAGRETELHRFPDSTAAAGAAADLVRTGDAVLVKGSRGVRMERIVDALQERFGRVDGPR